MLLLSLRAAGDEVRYTAASGQVSKVSGTVLDFAGDQLVLRLESGAEQRIPADRVREILTARTDPHRAGLEAQQSGDDARAVEQLFAALRVEPRPWVQREILAAAVRSTINLGQPDRACNGFLTLMQRDPQSPHFACIPLCWQPYQPTPAFQQQASSWIEQRQHPAATLLGASWLLSTSQRAAAIESLRRLSLDPDRRVSALAQAQLWRTRVATARPEETASLEQLIAGMPADLRGGPRYVLGLVLSAQGESERAALAFLRLPILHACHRPLAAAGLVAAARELERLDRRDEAQTLYREAIRDYAGTEAAAEAAARLAP